MFPTNQHEWIILRLFFFLCMCRLASNIRILYIAFLSGYICHQHDQLQNLFKRSVHRMILLHVWNDFVSFFNFVSLKIIQTVGKFSTIFAGYEFISFFLVCRLQCLSIPADVCQILHIFPVCFSILHFECFTTIHIERKVKITIWLQFDHT